MASFEKTFGQDELNQLMDYVSKKRVIIGLQCGSREFLKLWLKNPTDDLTDSLILFAQFYNKTYHRIEGTQILTIDEDMKKFIMSDAFKTILDNTEITKPQDDKTIMSQIDELVHDDEFKDLPSSIDELKQNSTSPQPTSNVSQDDPDNVMD